MPYRIVVCDTRKDLLATLDAVLRHWGYRVLSARDTNQANEFLKELSPDLFFIEEELLITSPRFTETLSQLQPSKPPVIAIESETTGQHQHLTTWSRLNVPLDIFQLFSQTQKHLEEIPRHNLRMNISLPGLLSFNSGNHLVEVVSLSSHGLFIKTPLRFMRGDKMQIIIPLFGMKREIEVACRVLYNIVPCNENNFLQGFGVEFTAPTTETLEAVQEYLEQRMLGEMSESRMSQYDVAVDQLKTRIDQSRLRLIMSH